MHRYSIKDYILYTATNKAKNWLTQNMNFNCLS